MEGGAPEVQVRPKRRRRRRWILAALLLAAAAGAILWWRRGPEVPSPCLLTIDLRGEVAERRGEGISTLFGPARIDLLEIRRALAAAAGDSRVQGIVLRVEGGALDLARAAEVRAMVEAFRRNGKFAVGFSESADAPAYLAIAGADEVLLDPAGELALLGISIQSFFLGGARQKTGLEFDLVRAGEFKGAYEQLTASEPSSELRRATGELADSLFASLLEGVASARKLPAGQVRVAIDEAPLSPARALELKLIDRLASRRELEEIARARAKGPAPRPIGARDYLAAIGEASGGVRVAVVHLSGILADGSGPPLPFLGETADPEEINRSLDEARDDPAVRAVVLRIDSPGGTLLAAEKVWRAVDSVRKVKPVIAALAGVAASGGYYAACGADRVIARPETITGSIGVFGGKLVAAGLLDAAGVNVEAASRGARAGMGSLARRFSDDERSALEKTVRDSYRLFVERVAAGRKRPYAEIDRVARGRVWSGREALDRGLVDELGGFEEALAAVRRLARLGDRERLDLVPFPPRRSILEILSRGKEEPGLAQGPGAGGFDARAFRAFTQLLDGRSALVLEPLGLRPRW